MSAAPPAPESRLAIALRWRDMDMLGHLNQAVYHELLEEGRGAIMATVGAHVAFVLARVEIDHLREVRRADGSIDVVTRVAEVGTKKVVMEQEVQLPGGDVAARARSWLVAWDPARRASRALTAEERVALGAP